MKPIETHETNPSEDLRAAKKSVLVLAGLKWLVAATATALCLRGQGQPFWWLILAVTPLAIHALVSPRYRLALSHWLRSSWAVLHGVCLPERRLPWTAVLLFVVLPAGLLFLSNNRNMGTGDTWPVMPTAASLVRDGDWDVREYLPAVPKAYWRDPKVSVPYCAV